MSNKSQSSRSQAEPYRERLSAEVEGLKKQVEQLRKHVQHGQPQPNHPHRNLAAAAAVQMHSQGGQSQHNPFGGGYGRNMQGSFNAQQLSQQQHMSQQEQQDQQEQQRRANLIASLPPSLLAGGGQDNYGGPQAPSQLGFSKDDFTSMMRGKQQSRASQLAKIMEERRKLRADLDSLERQRQQILDDPGGAASSGNFHDLQDRFGSNNPHLRSMGGSSNIHHHMGGGGPRGGPGFGGGHAVPPSIIAGARDALQRYPSAMQFPGSNNGGNVASAMASSRNHPMSENDLTPQQVMDGGSSNFGGSNIPSGRGGYPTPPSGAANNVGSNLGHLKRARGDFDVAAIKREEMEVAARRSSMNADHHSVDHFGDKRRRMMTEAALREELQKRHLDTTANFSAAAGLKPTYGGRVSSLYPPNEILLGDKQSHATDSISALSSSHRLLASQREAQNMLYYGNSMNSNGSNRSNGSPTLNSGFFDPMQHDRKLPEKKQRLSKNFVPEADTVVLGKGNIPKTNFGNLKLKGLVMDSLMEYANGERRKKIAVISKIIRWVTSRNYQTTGFVKFEDDTWWEMTERDARVKITALFRDCLHDQYRSSSSSKVKRRQELRKREITGGGSPTGSTSENDKEKEGIGIDKSKQTLTEEGNG
ncbi:unnamed protein product [Pseudo-nitzschia multistriata]|uniref:DUF6824 domain-containing protein n=1 Tax=Pseudo-nitzschia multistriata TaxID=183589 RepID=A0A448Z6Z2_9STRA|nr:unnamed protein product [Pseudo-nitzschia multistriata]